MAGSIKWFVYTADDGSEFAYQADESWTEAVVAGSGQPAGTGDYDANATAKYALPRNVKPRRVLLQSTDGLKRATVTCPNQAVYNGIGPNDTFTLTDPQNGSFTLTVNRVKGEEIGFPKAADTALQDGDAT